MANCAKPYYCYDFEPYPSETDCETKEYYLAGISAIGLLRCDATVTDPGDAEELQTLINEGKLIVIKGVACGLDEPSPVQIDSLTACGGQLTITADRTATFVDGKVSKEVVEWYNTNKASRFGGVLLFECAENRTSFVNAEVTMSAFRAMAQRNNEAQSISGTLSWRQLADPVPYTGGSTIFT